MYIYEKGESMAKKKFLATSIDWDTDGETVELPSNVWIPNDIDEKDIADYLSDRFGWCVKSFLI